MFMVERKCCFGSLLKSDCFGGASFWFNASEIEQTSRFWHFWWMPVPDSDFWRWDLWLCVSSSLRLFNVSFSFVPHLKKGKKKKIQLMTWSVSVAGYLEPIILVSVPTDVVCQIKFWLWLLSSNYSSIITCVLWHTDSHLTLNLELAVHKSCGS